MVAENDSDLQTLTCDLGNIKFYFVNTPCMSAMRFLDSCAVTLILSKHSFGFVIDSNSITIDRDLPESLVKPPRSTSFRLSNWSRHNFGSQVRTSKCFAWSFSFHLVFYTSTHATTASAYNFTCLLSLAGSTYKSLLLPSSSLSCLLALGASILSNRQESASSYGSCMQFFAVVQGSFWRAQAVSRTR